jgi:hypothetical protein
MGQQWNGALRMITIKMNVLLVVILHYTISFVAYYTKEALSKIKRKKR